MNQLLLAAVEHVAPQVLQRRQSPDGEVNRQARQQPQHSPSFPLKTTLFLSNGSLGQGRFTNSIAHNKSQCNNV